VTILFSAYIHRCASALIVTPFALRLLLVCPSILIPFAISVEYIIRDAYSESGKYDEQHEHQHAHDVFNFLHEKMIPWQSPGVVLKMDCN